jgi:hypothetical protein
MLQVSTPRRAKTMYCSRCKSDQVTHLLSSKSKKNNRRAIRVDACEGVIHLRVVLPRSSDSSTPAITITRNKQHGTRKDGRTGPIDERSIDEDGHKRRSSINVLAISSPQVAEYSSARSRASRSRPEKVSSVHRPRRTEFLSPAPQDANLGRVHSLKPKTQAETDNFFVSAPHIVPSNTATRC